MKLYIVGPMRGIPYFNYPQFDTCRDSLREQGHDPISPADLERAAGFDEMKHPRGIIDQSFNLDAACERDIRAVLEADGVCLLPHWAGSLGSRMEVFTALFLGRQIYAWNEDGHLWNPGKGSLYCALIESLEQDCLHLAKDYINGPHHEEIPSENREIEAG